MSQTPWKYDPEVSAIVTIDIDAHKVRAIADFGKIDDHEDDARLMARSQDLLAALEVAVQVMRDHNIDESMAGEFEIFTDVIAAAKGSR